MTQITIDACVSALAGAAMQQKRVVHTQMAVGLAVFHSLDKVDKTELQAVYAKAGLDCADSLGQEYNTVRRKIKATSALHAKLTPAVISEWIGAHRNARAILAITSKLASLNLDTIEKVLAYAGAGSSIPGQVKAREARKAAASVSPEPPAAPPMHEQPAPAEAHRRHEDSAHYLLKIDTPHMHIAVEDDTTVDELQEAIHKLQVLVKARSPKRKMFG